MNLTRLPRFSTCIIEKLGGALVQGYQSHSFFHFRSDDICTLQSHPIIQWSRQGGRINEALLYKEFTEASSRQALGILLTASFTTPDEVKVCHSDLLEKAGHHHKLQAWVCSLIKNTTPIYKGVHLVD